MKNSLWITIKQPWEKYKGNKATKKTKNRRAYRTAIITDTSKVAVIEEEEREAYEDFFENETGKSESPEQD